ncbi:ribosomal RNA Processing 5 [Oratosquilla oratoria]|uniref:ribosomal RNA Processing 5 n=1 Tax=Oratosquilla oratoria TaxID=337810 RepID=UPI003F75C80E
MKTGEKERELFSVKGANQENRKKRKLNDEEKKNKKKKREHTVVIDELKYETLFEGMQCFGCVQAVRDYEVIVSLPHGLVGTVPITHISDAYTANLRKVTEAADSEEATEDVASLQEVVTRGQHVSVRVSALQKKENFTKVILSMVPQDVNSEMRADNLKVGSLLWCSIKSIEDNGFVIDAGVPKLHAAFLTRKDAPKGLHVGSMLWCVVKKVISTDDDMSVSCKLSADPSLVNKAVWTLVEEDLTYDRLSSGVQVEAIVDKVQREGLVLTVGIFTCVVSKRHLAGPFDLPGIFKAGQKVTGRVMFATTLTKVLHLTLQHSDISSTSMVPKLDATLGEVVEDNEVYDSNQGGVYLKLADNIGRGYCSSNKLGDTEKIPKCVKEVFPIGRKVCCRVLHYNFFDKFFIISLQSSVIRQQLVKYSEAKLGDLLTARIKELNANGAVVALGQRVDGIVPTLHLMDVENKEKKFLLNNTLTGRVLRVDAAKRKLILTCLKKMTATIDPLITEWTEDNVGVISDGVIVHIVKSGLIVAFYNDVRGFVPQSHARLSKGEQLDEIYQKGQVVKCRVMEVNLEAKQMTLSLCLGSESVRNLRKKREEEEMGLKIRSQVNCVVKDVNDSILLVDIEGYDKEGRILIQDLSDHDSISRLRFNNVSKGDRITNAVVMMIGNPVSLSLKDSLYHLLVTTESVPNSVSEFKEGQILPAIVTEVRNYGVMVTLPTEEKGWKSLVHKNNMDNFDDVIVGQNLLLEYKGLDSKKRLILSTKLDGVQEQTLQSGMQLVRSFLREEEELKNQLAKGEGLLKRLANLKTGEKVEVTVTGVTDLGLAVHLGDRNVPGIIWKEHLDQDKYEVGCQIQVRVLYIDLLEGYVELSARGEVCGKFLNNTESIKVNKSAKCCVLAQRSNFIQIMLLSKWAGVIAYIPGRQHFDSLRGNHAAFAHGQECRVIIKHVEGSLVLAIPDNENNKGMSCQISSVGPSICCTSGGVRSKKDEEDERADETVEERLQRLCSFSKPPEETKDSQDKAAISDKQMKKLLKKEERKRRKRELQRQKNLEKKEAQVSDENEESEDEECLQMKPQKRIKVESVKEEEEMTSEMEEEEMTSEMEEKEGEELEGKKVKKSKRQVAKEEKRKKAKESKQEKLEKSKNKKNREQMKKMEADDSGVDADRDEDEKSPEKCLEVEGTNEFVWEIPKLAVSRAESSESEEEEEEEEKEKKKEKKLSKKEQKVAAVQEEQLLHRLECARLDEGRIPQSAMDYEELLQRSPNSSAVWIQFISFYLESAEIDKARAIAKRALDTIGAQEENERLNVWRVLLLLEVLYGTSESTQDAFKEAQITNDQLKIFSIMASVYGENNKDKEAEGVYHRMTKKFNKNIQVWVEAAKFHFQKKKFTAARKLLDKSLLSLEKKQHVEVINQFAQMEFRYGDSEKGRTMMESLLSNYPKRTDIWSVYVDLLVKAEDVNGARNVLDRMTVLKLPLKKMRFIFKKFLDFEKKHGTTQSIEAVKKRVEDFVTAALHEDE